MQDKSSTITIWMLFASLFFLFTGCSGADPTPPVAAMKGDGGFFYFPTYITSTQLSIDSSNHSLYDVIQNAIGSNITGAFITPSGALQTRSSIGLNNAESLLFTRSFVGSSTPTMFYYAFATDPSEQFLYAGGGYSSTSSSGTCLLIFSKQSINGTLTPVVAQPSQVSTAISNYCIQLNFIPQNIFFLSTNTGNTYLYVMGSDVQLGGSNGYVAIYNVNEATGALTLVQMSSSLSYSFTTTYADPLKLIFSSDKSTAFLLYSAVDGEEPQALETYSVDSSTGALTKKNSLVFSNQIISDAIAYDSYLYTLGIIDANAHNNILVYDNNLSEHKELESTSSQIALSAPLNYPIQMLTVGQNLYIFNLWGQSISTYTITSSDVVQPKSYFCLLDGTNSVGSSLCTNLSSTIFSTVASTSFGIAKDPLNKYIYAIKTSSPYLNNPTDGDNLYTQSLENSFVIFGIPAMSALEINANKSLTSNSSLNFSVSATPTSVVPMSFSTYQLTSKNSPLSMPTLNGLATEAVAGGFSMQSFHFSPSPN